MQRFIKKLALELYYHLIIRNVVTLFFDKTKDQNQNCCFCGITELPFTLKNANVCYVGRWSL
jgi:hypothetical protein